MDKVEDGMTVGVPDDYDRAAAGVRDHEDVAEDSGHESVCEDSDQDDGLREDREQERRQEEDASRSLCARLTGASWWLWLSAVRLLGFLPVDRIRDTVGGPPALSTAWARYSMVLFAGLTLVRSAVIAAFWSATRIKVDVDVFSTVYLSIIMIKAGAVSVVTLACLRASCELCTVFAALRRCADLHPLRRPECWRRLLAVNTPLFAFLVFFPCGYILAGSEIDLVFDAMSDACDLLTSVLFLLLDAVFVNEVAVVWALCTDLRLRVLALLPLPSTRYPRPRPPPTPWTTQLSVGAFIDGVLLYAPRQTKASPAKACLDVDKLGRSPPPTAPSPAALSWRNVRRRQMLLHDVIEAMCSAHAWSNLVGIAVSLFDGSVSIFSDLTSRHGVFTGTVMYFSTAWGVAIVAKFAFICYICQQVENEHTTILHTLCGFIACHRNNLKDDERREVRDCISQIELLGNGFTAMDIINLDTKTMASTIGDVISYLVVLLQFDFM